jgi:DNA polymerase III sliding clamp (beta) subunit (PCNA family)
MSEIQTEKVDAENVENTEPFKEKIIEVEFSPFQYNVVNKLVKVMNTTTYGRSYSYNPIWLRFDTNGLHVREMDPSHVTMIELRYNPQSFARYGVIDPITFPFTENTVIKNAKNPVTLKCIETKDKWIYTLSETPKESTIEVNKEDTPNSHALPNLTFDVSLIIDRKILLDFLRANREADEITLIADRSTMTLTLSTTIDNVTNKMTLTKDRLLALDFLDSTVSDAKAIYSAEYLKAILQAIPTESIKLSFKRDYPCCVSFILETKDINIDYYLAPILR